MNFLSFFKKKILAERFAAQEARYDAIVATVTWVVKRMESNAPNPFSLGVLDEAHDHILYVHLKGDPTLGDIETLKSLITKIHIELADFFKPLKTNSVLRFTPSTLTSTA